MLPRKSEVKLHLPRLYFYDNDIIGIAKSVEPSRMGEKEIASANNEYLKRIKLKVKLMGCDMVWIDTGTIKAS